MYICVSVHIIFKKERKERKKEKTEGEITDIFCSDFKKRKYQSEKVRKKERIMRFVAWHIEREKQRKTKFDTWSVTAG